MRAFISGEISPPTWRVLSWLLILQFQGMLLLAWLFRSPHVSASTPFRDFISTLGQGRLDGNTGGWIFLGCFCLFALLLVPWHLHLANRVTPISTRAARALRIIGMVSLIGVACVGIFDEQRMGPVSIEISRFMHGFGAITAFGGHCIVAFLTWYLFAISYARSTHERRSGMSHPGKLLVSVVLLVLPLILVCALQLAEVRHLMAQELGAFTPDLMWRVPFWQWSLMLALMLWLFSMGLLYPRSFSEEAIVE